MLLAKSKERESMVEDGVIWWKEYQLSKDALNHNYMVAMRYMCRVGDKTYACIDGRVALFTDPETTWTRWGVGRTPKEAVEDVIGDTDFYEATSLHKLHARAVERLRADRERSKKQRQAQERYQRALERVKDWKFEQQQLFTKRHGHKEGDAYQKALDRTKKRLQPEYDRLVAEMNEAKAAIEGQTPSC